MTSRKFELCFLVSSGLPAPGQTGEGKILVYTRVRAFDEHSYHWCRLMVSRNTFGLISRKSFFFCEIHGGIYGDRYGIDSKEVADAFNTYAGKPYFVIRKTSRTAR